MHPDMEDLRPKLKEILYDCAVDIRATKAAIYLFEGTTRYELAADYGFRGGLREVVDLNDPIVDRCGRGRTPFYVNGVASEPRFSEILWAADTDRLLVAPIYVRGKFVGLIDMRDKAGKGPFEQEDIPKAQKIADRFGDLFLNSNTFGHIFIALSEISAEAKTVTSRAELLQPPGSRVAAGADVSPVPPVVAGAAAQSAPSTPMSAPPLAVVTPPIGAPRPAPRSAAPANRAADNVPRLATTIIEARSAVSSLLMPSTPEVLSSSDLQVAGDILRAILLIPGAAAAMFSAFGHAGGVQEIAARSTMGEDARNLLQSKLSVWLGKRGEAAGYVTTTVLTPFGTSGPPVTGNDLQKVFTAALVVGSLRGLYLTVAFEAAPDRAGHELLAALHAQLQIALEHSMHRSSLATLRVKVAEKLLEPDFARYPHLRRHSEAVSRLAEAFARHLGLSATEADAARVAGLLHDVGMRMLDYERLYRKPHLSEEELSMLREHVSVGAAVIEPMLGPEIARIVLCHHERIDGRGYPNGLHSEEIPTLSKLIHICEAYVAMVDPESYQPSTSPENALSAIARAAGEQFDGELSPRFVEFMRTQPSI